MCSAREGARVSVLDYFITQAALARINRAFVRAPGIVAVQTLCRRPPHPEGARWRRWNSALHDLFELDVLLRERP